MTDDLVKRLREVKDWWREPGRTAEQAADRIEALEAALNAITGVDMIMRPDDQKRIVNRMKKIARAALEGKNG
jgi:hypothetical protein